MSNAVSTFMALVGTTGTGLTAGVFLTRAFKESDTYRKIIGFGLAAACATVSAANVAKSDIPSSYDPPPGTCADVPEGCSGLTYVLDVAPTP